MFKTIATLDQETSPGDIFVADLQPDFNMDLFFNFGVEDDRIYD